jgi:hypothetical protein
MSVPFYRKNKEGIRSRAQEWPGRFPRQSMAKLLPVNG